MIEEVGEGREMNESAENREGEGIKEAGENETDERIWLKR